MSARNGVELSTLKEEGDEIRQAVTLPRASIGSRVYRKSILRHSSSLNPQDSDTGPSSLDNALTSTPKESRRSSARRPARYASEPSISQIPETPTKNKGKRKAEDLDLTPPDNRISHTTFVIPPGHRRTHLQSEPSRAPITYQHKRVRLSSQSPASTPSHSRPGSLQHAAPSFTDSPLYRLSNPPPSPAIRAISRATSTRSMQPSAVATSNPAPSLTDSRRERRRSVSEISFPIGAIVSPQPPSISRSSAYHMRDPRRPPRTHSTPWTPHLKSVDDEASPIHAWLFYVSFILFPLWWIASFLPIPRTRVVGGSDTEKAVPLDDPQIEHDARTWRFRCRIMAGISFLTYIPFIVLVAVFASR
ncbi:hypothetical protein BDY19DRAFT_890794 [Irpex rosettiformis]|uniref:Uncharacterized protein n=1 Tax=Irpex rosettiformis TaxID=378272 RepID=A0ACB8U2T9_9APHY|nr:hypothetical protein BDY19DRAFT_890794 [Irpex rosettiformis]